MIRNLHDLIRTRHDETEVNPSNGATMTKKVFRVVCAGSVSDSVDTITGSFQLPMDSAGLHAGVMMPSEDYTLRR